MKLIVCLAVLLGLAASAWAQAAKPLAYDVVSVKPNKSESGDMRWGSTPDGVKMENVTLKMLVGSAYGLKDQMNGTIEGLPKWAEEQHFDLEAKVAPEDVEAFKKLKHGEREAMLVAALEDRFKLKAHKEVRQLPVYTLVVAKSGVKAKLAVPGDTYEKGMHFDGKPSGPGSMSVFMKGSTVHMDFQAVEISNFAQNLTYQVERQVNDATGLTGKYDFSLEFAPSPEKEDAGNSVPGIFTALEEQLGLKLVPAKGPVDCVVVEHVEQPSAN
jgi:uncharacterized protein (TIGR03435 family)